MMADSAGISMNTSFLPIYAEAQLPMVCEHPLLHMDPSCLDLPGPNWQWFKMNEKSLMICELVMSTGPESPRVRKHIQMNLSNGICTSYVMDHKISDMLSITRLDVERCIEELDMMHACVGGPSASKFPPAVRTNSRVDIFGNWRHNSCKIITSLTGLSCTACESLLYELSQLAQTSKEKKSNDDVPKRLRINSLSHRKQSQIIALRKRRQYWSRKKRTAEKEMIMIEDMLAEVLEGPEENGHTQNDNDDDDDEDDE